MRVNNCTLVALLGLGLVQGSFLSSNISPADTLLNLADEFSCVAHCNGAMVTSNNNNCEGVFYNVCKVGGNNIVISCVGTWNETLSPEYKVDAQCIGLYNSNSEGTTPAGTTYSMQSSCGGSIDFSYYIKSPTSVVSGSSVNTTCNGNYAKMLKTGDNDIVSVGCDNEFLDAPSGYNCVYTCGEVAYDGVFCQKGFQVNCDVDKNGRKADFVYTCDRIFVGDWSGSGCVGNGKTISTGATYALTETCTEYSGNKKVLQGEEKACVGTYSASIRGFPPPHPAPSHFNCNVNSRINFA